MRWPLRNQILVPMVAVMLGVLIAGTLANVYLSVSDARSRIERQLRSVAQTLAQSSFPLTDAVLAQMRGLSGAEYVLTDSSGQVLAATYHEYPTLDTLPPPAAFDAENFRLEQPVQVGSGRYFHAVFTLERAIGPHRNARMHMLYPESSYSDAWRKAAYPPLLIGGLGILLVMLLAGLIAARVGGPLGLLRRQVGQIADGDFRPLPLPNRDDEIRDLAQAVNRMAEMLSGYEEQVRRTEQLRTLGQLGSGIAHQMRNSLTGCRIALDLHRRECPQRDDCESLDVAERQLALMENYIQRFLNRSKGAPAAADPVDLAALIERTLPLLTPAARHAHVDFTVHGIDAPAVIRGDANDLEQLLVNLVLNAIDAASRQDESASPEGRFVRIVLRKPSPERIVLEVQDSGRGPDTRLQDRLFDPLVTGKPDGTGLGLFIARDVAQRHGGTIEWRRENGVTCFTVELPPLAAASLPLAVPSPPGAGTIPPAAEKVPPQAVEEHCVEIAGR